MPTFTKAGPVQYWVSIAVQSAGANSKYVVPAVFALFETSGPLYSYQDILQAGDGDTIQLTAQ